MFMSVYNESKSVKIYLRYSEGQSVECLNIFKIYLFDTINR